MFNLPSRMTASLQNDTYMWLDSLQYTEDCVVPLPLDLFHSGLQDSEKIFTRPPHRRLRSVFPFSQGVELGPILHLFYVVLYAFCTFRAFVICVDERKSRPRPMVHASYEYRDLCLVYAVGQIGCFGTKRRQLEELQIARASQWLVVRLEALVFDELWTLFASVEGKMKF